MSLCHFKLRQQLLTFQPSARHENGIQGKSIALPSDMNNWLVKILYRSQICPERREIPFDQARRRVADQASLILRTFAFVICDLENDTATDRDDVARLAFFYTSSTGQNVKLAREFYNHPNMQASKQASRQAGRRYLVRSSLEGCSTGASLFAQLVPEWRWANSTAQVSRSKTFSSVLLLFGNMNRNPTLHKIISFPNKAIFS
ncbi:hypothetical protein T06_11968 [Trichinella sp. T6]|nr:hypothetical protein T06_11968 [Trichinella sp. T6]